MVVSIAPIEAAQLADRFPIAWRQGGGIWDLVCLVGLTPDHDYWRAPPFEDHPGQGMLPLLLQAYPFTVVDDGETEALTILRDDDVGSSEGDVLFDERGEPTGDTERRCQALWTFVGDRRRAEPLFAALGALDVFKPWDLTFPDAKVKIEGLFTIDSAFFGSKSHILAVESHGWQAANLLTLHRISLYRAAEMVGHRLQDTRATQSAGQQHSPA
ncbi:MAG: SapC family protein [Alsobacter sp.]